MIKTKNDDLYNKVLKQIKKVREQGEPPRADVISMDNYICDLCKGSISNENITQCGLCGRWICKKNCWDDKSMVCISCSGVIKLCKDSFEIGSESKNVEKDDNRKKATKVKDQKTAAPKFKLGKKSKK
ncbi:MAG: hypothetical protein JSV49_10640 [Thermoplasmata archaeon]|nr:MAG: hypothetical protein JSV49_10640 [Thermoplasmata archaeon]